VTRPPPPGSVPLGADRLATLASIERRVLWLATNIVHHANVVRPNRDGSKVGGHQASSSSMVSIMTALYFHQLRAGDRVAVKPHASPVLHAVQYLLGRLERRFLPTLRSFEGLQAYPSRTKDPFTVDFSTGSVGFGAVAPLFAALAHTYAVRHFGTVTSRRFFALVGDAELDEGNVWEALFDPALDAVTNVTWVVDLNRQSLDRVVPGIRADGLRAQFEACGWNVLEAKYGSRLQELFRRPGGSSLRRTLDAMSNQEYQYLIRRPGDEVRAHLVATDREIVQAIDALDDDELPAALGQLGGHDLAQLIDAFERCEAVEDRPSVVLAYTVKGWGLPFAGDPLNHSKLLTRDQMAALRADLAIPDDEWAAFDDGTAEALLCQEAARRLRTADAPARRLRQDDVPSRLDLDVDGVVSTQQAFGRLLTLLARHRSVSKRIVTAAPDVATSTNLSGWVLKQGLFHVDDRRSFTPKDEGLLAWEPSSTGKHIELGISEMNLFTLLGAFGMADDLCGQHLVPIGTVYDPFVCRGLDAFIYGLYSDSRFIVVGTPSGVSLSPEGGAHQSTVTPSLGMELPHLDAYEPCYAQELEWLLLEAIRQCARGRDGRSTYLRLSTKPVDQSPFLEARQRLGSSTLLHHVLAGGYRLVDWRETLPKAPRERLVHLAAVGAMVPEAVEAARSLQKMGVPSNVLALTSPRLLYESWREAHEPGASMGPFDWLLPEGERHAPIVTVLDGASHALAWMGSVYGNRVAPLGVDEFGQSGERHALYASLGIDAASIVDAALRALVREGVVVPGATAGR
jgi:pyruvate dehydrogenase E1 component